GGNNTATVTATGALGALNTALNGLTYTPTLNFNGSDTLTITANDNGNTGAGGSLTGTKLVPIFVNAVNDAPVNTVPLSITVTEDVASPLTGLSFADVDAGSNNVVATLSVPSGSLAAPNNPGLTGVTIGGTSSTMTLTGTIAAINAFLGGSNVTFTTALN